MIANSLFSRQSKAKGFTPHLFRGWGSLNSQPNRKGAGFTLLELLIVITILAILAVIIIFVLNPAETLRKSRDVQRLSDLATLKNSIALYITSTTTPYLGNSSSNATCKTNATTYASGDLIWYSLPSSSAITDTTLDGGTTYPLKNQVATPAGVDGTGWIPVNLGGLSGGSPISNLPIDPTNTISDLANVALTDLVYRYSCEATNLTFEINANLESTAYTSTDNKESKDGGDNANLYEMGTGLGLLGDGATVPF